ncbi:hypothetical protein ACET3Z_018249 [Daucus carota]
MEDNNSLMPGRIIFAFDAHKERSDNEFKNTINGIRLHRDMIHGGDTVLVVGVLHKILHPFGYQIQASPEAFTKSNLHLVEEEVSKRVDLHVSMLLESALDCKDEGVDFEVKIVAGTPTRRVVLQEAKMANATWIVLDRHLKRDLQFYLKHIPCKVAIVLDNLTVEVMRSYTAVDKDNIEHEVVYSMSKSVPLSSDLEYEHSQQSVISFTSYIASITSSESSELLQSNSSSSSSYRGLEHIFPSNYVYVSTPMQQRSGRQSRGESMHASSPLIQKQKKHFTRSRSSDAPLLCATCKIKTELYIKESMRFSYSEIQLATDKFSKENLLGEGGYGHVYKGELEDGQLIAAKMRKETSTQGFQEFSSEVYVLSFARHKNIVMLLGYCCKENVNILVYEYICNKSLEWHLFDQSENFLNWKQRRSIAIGTAKGLRFLHEECRGSPIIHRDLRPSNILLTHDFVPMLGDFGLAKWKQNDSPIHTRILGTLGYLAPEYVENGIVSVRSDVYSFGIVLVQLISGRKVVESNAEHHRLSLRQWAEPIIESLALHELIDPRLGESYDTCELYHMARAAYLCLKNDPEMRPSMAEVVRLLEADDDHLHSLVEQFMPRFSR